MAQTLLLKNDWDADAVTKKYNAQYMKTTFEFDQNEAKLVLEENKAEDEFMCTCCYCDYDINEAVEMSDCGHRLCFHCF